MKKQVLNVGHCAKDHPAISAVVTKHYAAEVTGSPTAVTALASLRDSSFDLILVNRIFDEDGASGIDFIRQLQADSALRNIPVMLVSNFPEWQEEAVKLGAKPGFGKNALGSPGMLERLRPHLA